MAAPSPGAHIVRFGPFGLDLRSGELRRDGRVVPLQEQPLQVLTVLLERPGELVTREELRQRLWPVDTYVGFEHGLNAAVKRLRDALGDSADEPQFVETVPRRGYRFVGLMDASGATPASDSRQRRSRRRYTLAFVLVAVTVVGIGLARYGFRPSAKPFSASRSATPSLTLTRLTFGSGVHSHPTWSPDGRFIAYSSDRSGNFDIWVQAVAGGDPVQITKNAAHDWQPDWSPRGDLIAFRSERLGGGVFLVRALGGEERRLTTFGFQPLWSPDGKRLAFLGSGLPDLENALDVPSRVFVTRTDGTAPQEVLWDVISPSAARASVAWHPDGRLSVFVPAIGPNGWTFSTVSIESRSRTDSEISAGVLEAIRNGGVQTWLNEASIAWSPFGDAVYCTLWSNHMRTLWKFDVDPTTLRWIGGPHRLTTGPGPDGNLAPSRDGTRLVFTTQPMDRRLWSFPLDSVTARLNGPASPITASELEGFAADLSTDGRSLVFLGEPSGARGHRHEIWKKTLDDGRETLVRTLREAEADQSTTPRIGSTGLIAYSRASKAAFQVFLLDAASGEESPLTQLRQRGWEVVGGWSADGQWVVASGKKYTNPAWGIWLLPLSAAPRADEQVRIVTTSLEYDLWQPVLSPDGRWVSFVALPRREPGVARLFAVPASGGQWIQLTDGFSWDDKPRWSSDGRYLYFLSSRSSLLNIWAMPFDSKRGHPGEPFQVTRFSDPRTVISPAISKADFGVGRGRMVIPVAQIASNIWMLDNVDR